MSKRRVSATQLARMMGTNPSTVQRWLTGSVPRDRTLVDLALCLQESLSWLHHGDGKPNAESTTADDQAAANAPNAANAGQTQATKVRDGTGEDCNAFASMSVKDLEAGLCECATRLQGEPSRIMRLSALDTIQSLTKELRARN